MREGREAIREQATRKGWPYYIRPLHRPHDAYRLE